MSETIQDPRLEHNSKLSQEFITKLAVRGRYPSVLDQSASLPLELTKLVRFAYNPSILEDLGCLLMAYRYHDGDTLSTKLALAQVAFDGKVLSNRTLEFPDNSGSVEDPKLFRMGDAVWICWVYSSWPVRPVNAVVRYGRLEGNKIVNIHQIEPKTPKTIEKNIVPFMCGTSLFCIYESEPEQVVYELREGKVVSEFRSPSPIWAYGPVRGGAPPVEYQGKLLRFFHSGMDNEWSGWRRRYFLGACVLDSAPPFTVQAISSRPVVYGSEIDPLNASDRSQCQQYKPRVVFPGGALEKDGQFLVSVGVNDSACSILKITESQLNFK